MLALGQMAVILTKCIDLSVAANLALTGMVVAMLNAAFPGVPVVALILLAVVIGRGARRDQRPPRLEARHPADRRHPRHADHLPRRRSS